MLEGICNQTKVVMTTVGPYALYGTALVNACALYGCDYVDITGEYDWMKRNVNEFQDMAIKSGARIVSFCGHDCIPWDVSTNLINEEMAKQFNGEKLQKVQFYDEIKAKPSGGSIATIFA